MNVHERLDGQYSNKSDEYYTKPRAELLEFIPADAEFFLDVGCAEGTFGTLLKENRNCTVWGVEPTVEAAEVAKCCLDKVINDTFSADLPELYGQRFDTIFFNDVLEHMVDPETALDASKQLLSERGRVIASIPNVLYFPVMKDLIINRDWRYTESGVLDNTHLRFYTRRSIMRLFLERGFIVEKIQGINPALRLKYRIANFLALNYFYDWRFLQFVVVARKPHTPDQ